MAIPSETIEQVAAANDIVEVIGTYFPLKRAGASFKALCPFHQEKTPSFTVSPQRQTFHCFGCGAGGSVFRFVMDYEHVDFPVAVHKLAARVGIAIVEERRSEDETQQHEARRLLLRLHSEAAEWFHENLLKRDLGAPARDYLKTRGMSREVAKSWKLGYAPESWDAFCQWASEEGYRRRELLSSGLVKLRDEERGDGEFYDRFRGRLMFPICDEQGRVKGFDNVFAAGSRFYDRLDGVRELLVTDIGRDAKTVLAVIKINASESFPVVTSLSCTTAAAVSSPTTPKGAVPKSRDFSSSW